MRRSSTDGEHQPTRTTSPDSALPSGIHSPPRPSTPHFDLALFPTTTLLRLLASLLQQITTANDQIRPELDDSGEETMAEDGSSNSRQSSVAPNPSPTTALFSSDAHDPPATVDAAETEHRLFSASRTSLAHPSSLLSFHARHIPSISIEAYLLRILKYCPTTNEVFLGLLVYFDRMSRLGTAQGVGGMSPIIKAGVGKGFAIDSYNVHRLVIAGVTVASKFFSGTLSEFTLGFVGSYLTGTCGRFLHQLTIRQGRGSATA